MTITTATPGILSDRQIRLLCELPIGCIEIKEPFHRESDDVKIHLLPLYEDMRDNVHAEVARIAAKYSSRSQVQVIPYSNDLMAKQHQEFQPMIAPFVPRQIRTRKVVNPNQDASFDALPPVDEKIISYGLSSYGYDVRCGNEFKIFTNINSTVVDPKNFDEKSFVEFKGDVCVIPPNSFALARTVERFCIPRDILTICLGKSTYARCGIIVNVTPFEPEWEGYVTLEFSNTTPLPAKIYANEGCAQVLFFRGSETCEVSYKDRGGKYQGQGAKPVPPKV